MTKFKILYITSKNDSDKELEAITWYPKYGFDNEIILNRKNSSELWGSGFDNPKIKNTLSIELIACISIGNIAITKENVKPHILSIQKSFEVVLLVKTTSFGILLFYIISGRLRASG